MRKWIFFPFLICCTLFQTQVLYSQDSNDTSFYQKAVSSAHANYMKTMGPNSWLYNGVVYERYWNTIAGHPFFLTDQFQMGNVYFEDGFYEGVPLQYDMHLDKLVSKTFSNDVNLQLVSEKIHSFTLGSHEFVRVLADSSQTSLIVSGFYERIYNGIYSVLVKRDNKIIRSLKTEERTERFMEYDDYYLLKDGIFHIIQNENNLLVLFANHKAEIRKFLRGSNIRFKKNPAATIVQTLKYYEQLKN